MAGPFPGRTLVAAISGTANAVLEAAQFDTPLSYEGLESIGSGLGTGGFIVFDDQTDLVAVAQGVARFLSVESCGQCTPCKSDGLAIAQLLDTVRTSTAAPDTPRRAPRRFATVDDGARCALAGQQRIAVASLIELGRESVEQHLTRSTVDASGRFLIAPIVDLVHDRAVVDSANARQAARLVRSAGTIPAPCRPSSMATLLSRCGFGRLGPMVADSGVDVSTVDEASPTGRPECGGSTIHRADRRRLIERLLDGLRSLRSASGRGSFHAAADSLAHELGRYVDLVGTVVYPELDRVTDGSIQ